MSELKIEIKESGAETTAKKLEGLEGQIKKLEQQSKRTNSVTEDQKKKLEELQKKTISATDGVGKFSQVLSLVPGQGNAVSSAFGALKTVMEGATSGFGLLGIAITATAAAFSYVSEEIKKADEAIKAQNLSIDSAISRISNYTSNIRLQQQAIQDATSAIRAYNTSVSNQQALEMGVASVEEYQGAIRSTENSLKEIDAQLRIVLAESLGTTSEDFERNTFKVRIYNNALRDLENGTITAVEFANRFSNINANLSSRISELTGQYRIQTNVLAERNAQLAEAQRIQSELIQEDIAIALDPSENPDSRRNNGPSARERKQIQARLENERAISLQIKEREEFLRAIQELQEFGNRQSLEELIQIEQQNMLLEEQLALAGKIAEQKRIVAEEERIQLEQANQEKILLEQKRIESQMALEERQASQRAKQEQIVGNAISNIQGLTMKSIDLAKQEGITRKEAFKSALDQWLKGFAIEQAFKGAENTINAIASYARYDYAAGSQFLAAAAGNFALAAAAGGSSAAIPNSGIAGSKAPEQRREETPTDSESRNITINVQGVATTEAGVGRAIRQALETEQRRR